MSDLPPIGATVRTRGGGTGIIEQHGSMYIPEGTFRCSLCFFVYPVSEAWVGELYGEHARWDSCVACQTREGAMLVFYVLSGRLVPGAQERPPERHTGANGGTSE